jgi:5-keto-L-gluconate epimerase
MKHLPKLSLVVQTPEVEKTVPVALLTGTLEEKFAKAAEFGADGVELMMTNPKKLDLKLILNILKANELEVSAIASGAVAFASGLTLLHPDPSTAKTARERFMDLIDTATALNAPLVTVGSFRGRLASYPGDGRAVLRDILIEAAEYAYERNVKIALEPINRYEADLIHTAEQGLQFAFEVGHPAFGLLLDTFHVNIEETSYTEPFICLGKVGKLFHVHLGDNNRRYPGQGLIDFHAIVSTLGELGYTGYLSAELLAKPDPDTAAQRTLSYMRTILEDL